MDYGIKVAKEGKDITSTDPRDYRFHSGINMLKIFKEGFGTKSVARGDVGTVDVTHNLGYKPMVFGYFKHPGSSCWFGMPCRTYNTYNIPNPRTTWDLIGNISNINNNTVRLKFYDGSPAMPSSPSSINYKYYILADPRQDDWYQPASSDTDDGSYSNDYGFKISRPGIDVKTAEPKNLVFSTAFNTFKEYAIVSVTGTDYTQEIVVSHGLDYPPAFLALGDIGGGQYSREDVIGRYRGSWGNICVDESNVYINTVGKVYVILFIDPLNE